jgi:hypothetical protein
MDDASRVTWSWVFFTLGCTVGVGFIVRWARWDNLGGYGPAPQVLWTLGFLALGFLVVSVQLRLPIWLRAWVAGGRAEQAEQAKQDAQGTYGDGA